jgi:putative ABC transport system permease protein
MATLDNALPAARQREAGAQDEVQGGIGLPETLRIAAQTLLANPLRTVLTALGVIIGVASVVALLAVGRGTQQQIEERITANGANLLTVRAEGAAGGGDATLTMDDAAALADPANVPDASLVSPESMGIASVTAGSESLTTMILGVTPAYQEIHNNKMASGSFIAEGQETSNVAVLGSNAVERLFGEGADPTGQNIRIRGQTYRVIGVLASKGASVFGFDDEAVLVPLENAQRRLFGGRVAGRGGKASISSIVVQARDKDSIASTQAQIEATLRERHDLPAYGGADDFGVNNQEDLIETLTETSRTMTLYLGAIAAISLVVGGIGIMNIMLVSVRERTREIGLRKAVGAREGDILMQFLIEALLLSTTGGLIGLTVGVLIAVVANESGQTRALVSLESVLLAVGFAMAVGLFFGIEPARRAAKLDPIEALRYE